MNPFMLAGSGSIYHWEIELLRLFIIYYFIFQLVFLKRKIFLSFSASVLTTSLYFIVYYLKGNSLGFFYFDFLLEVSLPLVVFIIYCFFTFLIRLLGLQYPITKRTDVYPISLFIPAEETVQKALVKREQEKVYYALAAFILLIILSTVFYYFLYFFGGYRYTLISTWQVVPYGLTNSHFIPYGVVYLPLLYLVYKGSWKAAIIVYLCWFLDLSLMDKAYVSFTEGKFFFLREAGREYISPYWDKALYFLRCFLLVYLARLLAVVCRVEHKRKSSQRL